MTVATTVVVPTPVYAVIIEDGHVREIRLTTPEELAAWADGANHTRKHTEKDTGNNTESQHGDG